MGGHGTWHLGVTTPGRFATLGPSAGWQSFYTYGGAERPTGPFGRSRAHVIPRSICPISLSAVSTFSMAEPMTMSPGMRVVTWRRVLKCTRRCRDTGRRAGHWWDGEVSPGVDCVDWQPMFDMEARTLDPYELTFNFITPSPATPSTPLSVSILL